MRQGSGGRKKGAAAALAEALAERLSRAGPDLPEALSGTIVQAARAEGGAGLAALLSELALQMDRREIALRSDLQQARHHLILLRAAKEASGDLPPGPDPAGPGAGLRGRLRAALAPAAPPPARTPGPESLDALLGASGPFLPEQLSEPLRQSALAALRGHGTPPVSVILPTWNRRHVLAPALSSALLQSYAAAEVIVIDDASDDGTADWIAEAFPGPLAEGRLKLVRQPTRTGVSAARNAGLAAAQGEIIAYLDSDNRWEPDHLAWVCAGLVTVPGAACAYSALARHNLGTGVSDVLYAPFDRAALERSNTIDLNSFVHRRGAPGTRGGFDVALTRLVDWDLILRATDPGQAPPPVAVPVITGQYFLHGAGLANITLTEAAEPNVARIRAKLAGAV